MKCGIQPISTNSSMMMASTWPPIVTRPRTLGPVISDRYTTLMASAPPQPSPVKIDSTTSAG